MRLGALAVALLLAGCADILPGAVGTPHDATAVFRPASMVADRETAAPGDVIELSFRDEVVRGILYVLEEEVGDTWVYRYYTTVWPEDGEPSAFQAAEDDVEVPAIGISGPGPDRVIIPPNATPGTWRICTGNAGENVCVRIEIVAEE
jgi:hypothetical protein